MEGSVSIPLESYDRMKDKIYALETENKELKGKLESLKIFRIARNENDLDLEVEPDAKEYLDKAFKDYADSFTPKDISRITFFNYAKRKTEDK